MNEKSFSIKGIENVMSFVSALSHNYEVLIKLDEFQGSKPINERWYIVEVANGWNDEKFIWDSPEFE